MVCCVTGHRPKGFPFEREEYEDLYIKYKEKLLFEIEKMINEGYSHFISGMADGADLDFANVVLELRIYYPNITLEAAMP